MSPAERATLAAVVEVLLSPRDRLRRLEVPREALEALRATVEFSHIPHGGADHVDQCAMVLQVLLGSRTGAIRSAADF